MNTLKKALQIANINRQNWRQELQMFLRSYRTTPHSTTQVAPHTLLFNREPKTKLGQASNSQTKDDDIRNRDKIAKQCMKAHADRTNKAANRMILQGDHVLVKNEQASKLTPTYDPCPAIVTDVAGTMITVHYKHKTITRNVSFLKVIPTQDLDNITNETQEGMIRPTPAKCVDSTPQWTPPGLSLTADTVPGSPQNDAITDTDI